VTHDPKYVGVQTGIANELADILYCVIRLAEHTKSIWKKRTRRPEVLSGTSPSTCHSALDHAEAPVSPTIRETGRQLGP